jgi:uncharacterized protein
MATTSADRILSLDIIRGIAVMGIFSVNIVGMAMIEFAYFYPPAMGFESLGDKIMWAGNMLVVDGRFRSLFSILFGASLVLVVERAVAAGRKGWQVHYPRMIVLLLFGLAHFYFFWWGDILANYALVGMIAFAFWRLGSRWLLAASLVALSLMYVPSIVSAVDQLTAPPVEAAAGDGAAEEADDGPNPEEQLAEDKQAHATLGAHLDYMRDVQSHRLGVLHGQMAEPAKSRDRDPLPRLRFRLFDALVGRDAGAKDRGKRHEIRPVG